METTDKRSVLIVGSGRLAHRVRKMVEENNYTVLHFDNVGEIANSKYHTIEKIGIALKDIDLQSVSMTYLLDEKDEKNLELIIALISLQKDIRITASLFNENIAPHLQAIHPNLTILNPAKIAAHAFVKALDEPVTRMLRYEPVQNDTKIKKTASDKLLKKLIITFGLMSFTATIYFRVYEHMSWLDASYFIVTTITTVGYGDINLLHASSLSKVIGIILILSSTVFMYSIFQLLLERILKKRVQQALGRKKYNYKNHVIVCGLGRLGYFIVEELLQRGEKIIIIEKNEDLENIDYFRNQGVDVYVGNARLGRILKDANVSSAKAIISVTSDDYINLEIGLNARSFQPGLRVILRIFDDSMATQLKEHLDIHLTLSMSAVADEIFFAELQNI